MDLGFDNVLVGSVSANHEDDCYDVAFPISNECVVNEDVDSASSVGWLAATGGPGKYGLSWSETGSRPIPSSIRDAIKCQTCWVPCPLTFDAIHGFGFLSLELPKPQLSRPLELGSPVALGR